MKEYDFLAVWRWTEGERLARVRDGHQLVEVSHFCESRPSFVLRSLNSVGFRRMKMQCHTLVLSDGLFSSKAMREDKIT